MSFYPPPPKPSMRQRIESELAKEQAAFEAETTMVPALPQTTSPSPDPGEVHPETEEV